MVLSMDGFQWDYPNKAATPNLDSLAKIGVISEIIPAFPSKTFPNHYTLATGLYPDHHGIVLNDHFNYPLQEWYRTSDRKAVEKGIFYGGEPIWNTAETQGVKAATLFWVGSEADINGQRPTYWKKYQHDMPFSDRIDTVVSWLKKPVISRPRLILWYLHQPDSWGHQLGPENPEILPKIQYLDSLVGIFCSKLQMLPIRDSINVIITSDHGMGQISRERVIILDHYIKKEWLEKETGSSPVFMFEPKTVFVDSVVFHLGKAGHLALWKKTEIPKNLHFGSHSNIMPLVALADSGWSIYWQKDLEKEHYLGGTHGYTPENRDMHAIFYAFGPDFRPNYVHEAFANIHLYNLMCKLLKIEAGINDGDLKKVQNMLR